jgi:hypothetical protein
VYAQLTILHKPAKPDVIHRGLKRVFGSDDRTVLQRSPLCSTNTTTWRNLVIYSTERPVYRLVSLPARNDELQVVVEPIGEDIRRASQSAWDGLRQALDSLSPTLQTAEVHDSTTDRVVLTAQTGLAVELQRRESLQLVVVGIATLLWLLLAVLTFADDNKWEAIGGGIPALIGGIFGVASATSAWKKGLIRWVE